MIDFPPAEVRAVDFPVGALAVRREDECTFCGADEDSDLAHELWKCGCLKE